MRKLLAVIGLPLVGIYLLAQQGAYITGIGPTASGSSSGSTTVTAGTGIVVIGSVGGPYTVAVDTADVMRLGANNIVTGTIDLTAGLLKGVDKTCEIVIGDPGAASSALANDNDSPQVCGNDTGQTLTITGVHCYSDAGSPTVTPIISGGGATTILTGALTCSQTAGGAAGTLNGTPAQTNGQTIDGNITTAGGTAKYAVIRITRKY